MYVLPFGTTWMNIDDIRLNEINQVENDTYHVILRKCESKTNENKAFVRSVVLPTVELVLRENEDNANFTVAKEDNEVHIIYAPPTDIEITEDEYNDARSRISKEIKTNSLKDTIKANVPYSIKDDFLMISGEKASYYFKSNERFYKFPICARTLNEINTSNLLKMNFTGIEFGCIILDDPNQ